jgi:hypothetical protein
VKAFVRLVLLLAAGAVGLAIIAIGALVAVATLWPALIWGAPPEIAAGITFDPKRPDPATAQFTAVLHERFPPGTLEAALRAALLAQGFRYDEPPICYGHEGQTIHDSSGGFVGCPGLDNRSLRYEWGRNVMSLCSNHLDTKWAVDAQGRITSINGWYEYVCMNIM